MPWVGREIDESSSEKKTVRMGWEVGAGHVERGEEVCPEGRA